MLVLDLNESGGGNFSFLGPVNAHADLASAVQIPLFFPVTLTIGCLKILRNDGVTTIFRSKTINHQFVIQLLLKTFHFIGGDEVFVFCAVEAQGRS